MPELRLLAVLLALCVLVGGGIGTVYWRLRRREQARGFQPGDPHDAFWTGGS
jgi:uncharacterized iron-regulated membrane protein